MPVRQRSISLPIVLASVAVALSIALLVGWTLVFSRYIILTRDEAGGVSLLVLGIISFVIIMVVMIVIAVFLVREILDSRKQYRFMDSVTHELKSPLASMRLSTQTMGNPRVSDAQREDLRKMVLSDIERLTVLIDDILAASRLESRTQSLNWVDVNLRELAHECLNAVERRYDTDEDAIAIDVPAGLIVRVDRSALYMVLTNLFDNALKYSDRPREIRLSVERMSSGKLQIHVQDRGIGISPRERRRVRRRFYRVPSESVRQRHGTGLGLFVVNGLVSRLGGELKIYSEGEGRGTRVTVRLPERALRFFPESPDATTENQENAS